MTMGWYNYCISRFESGIKMLEIWCGIGNFGWRYWVLGKWNIYQMNG